MSDILGWLVFSHKWPTSGPGGYTTPAVSRVPNKGTKSEVAHKWAECLHKIDLRGENRVQRYGGGSQFDFTSHLCIPEFVFLEEARTSKKVKVFVPQRDGHGGRGTTSATCSLFAFLHVAHVTLSKSAKTQLGVCLASDRRGPDCLVPKSWDSVSLLDTVSPLHDSPMNDKFFNNDLNNTPKARRCFNFHSSRGVSHDAWMNHPPKDRCGSRIEGQKKQPNPPPPCLVPFATKSTFTMFESKTFVATFMMHRCCTKASAIELRSSIVYHSFNGKQRKNTMRTCASPPPTASAAGRTAASSWLALACPFFGRLFAAFYKSYHVDEMKKLETHHPSPSATGGGARNCWGRWWKPWPCQQDEDSKPGCDDVSLCTRKAVSQLCGWVLQPSPSPSRVGNPDTVEVILALLVWGPPL